MTKMDSMSSISNDASISPLPLRARSASPILHPSPFGMKHPSMLFSMPDAHLAFAHHASPLAALSQAYEARHRLYGSPSPTVPVNDPTANECKEIEYRGQKVAAFEVSGETMLCLPQVFDLFLKQLVGGLHTVYTKLKRLDIVPIVCNVEQVRVLRGLGAIQPGVNRCKLLSAKHLDMLYRDCTTASSRPGRPPKRGPSSSLLASLGHGHEFKYQLKKPRLDLTEDYVTARLSGGGIVGGGGMGFSLAALNENRRLMDCLSSGDLRHLSTADQNAFLNILTEEPKQKPAEKSPLFLNGYNAPPHTSAQPFFNASQQLPRASAPSPERSTQHRDTAENARHATVTAKQEMGMMSHLYRSDSAVSRLKEANVVDAERAAAAMLGIDQARLRELTQANGALNTHSFAMNLSQKHAGFTPAVSTPTQQPTSFQYPIANLKPSYSDHEQRSAAQSGHFHLNNNGRGHIEFSHQPKTSDTDYADDDNVSEDDEEKSRDLSDCPDDVTSSGHGYRASAESAYQTYAQLFSIGDGCAPGSGHLSATGGQGTNSLETLLRNIHGLLKVVAENARLQECQIKYEKAELKMEVLKERELKDTLEKQLMAEQKIKVMYLRRLKREKRVRRHLQQQAVVHDLKLEMKSSGEVVNHQRKADANEIGDRNKSPIAKTFSQSKVEPVERVTAQIDDNGGKQLTLHYHNAAQSI